MQEKPGSRAHILSRLVQGATWLIATQEQLLSMPSLGVGTPLEDQFLLGIDLWDCLHNVVDSGGNNCVLEASGPCKEKAIVTCRACALSL